MKKYGFIGGGRIASALIAAMLDGGADPRGIFVSDIDENILAAHRSRGLNAEADNAGAAKSADIIVLAVKPQHFETAVSDIRDASSGKTVLSVAAGVGVAAIRKALPGAGAVVRAMPNTPMLLGAGTVALAFSGAELEEKDEITGLFSACGRVFEVSEDMMDIVTAVSGSGPAYFYRVAAAIAGRAAALGMDGELAVALAASTMEGAARMLLLTGKTPGELIAEVASPGGTTLAALAAFDESGLDGAVAAGVEAAFRRSKELGEKI